MEATFTWLVLYNFVGAAAWVVLCVGAGLLFGNIPVIKENFSLVTIGIVVVSLLPIAIGWIKRGRRSEVRGQRSEVRGQRSEARGVHGASTAPRLASP